MKPLKCNRLHHLLEPSPFFVLLCPLYMWGTLCLQEHACLSVHLPHCPNECNERQRNWAQKAFRGGQLEAPWELCAPVVEAASPKFHLDAEGLCITKGLQGFQVSAVRQNNSSFLLCCLFFLHSWRKKQCHTFSPELRVWCYELSVSLVISLRLLSG